MLIQINERKEEEEIIKMERNLMLRFNLSYTELQNIPILNLKIWSRQEKEEEQRKIFNEMVSKNR